MNLSKNDKFWTNRKIDWESHYWNLNHPMRQEIIRIMKNYSRFRSVLEIGCGAGANLFNIRKAFKDTMVAGCDINSDAIKIAKEKFKEHTFPKIDRSIKYTENEHPRRKDLRETNQMFLEEHELREVELKVGNIEALPFNGEAYDLVLTHAMLMYIPPNRIDRALREIRRVGYNSMMFIELHSPKWFDRFAVWWDNNRSYYAYDYQRLLEKHHFKRIRLHKITKHQWPVHLWANFGRVITCIR